MGRKINLANGRNVVSRSLGTTQRTEKVKRRKPMQPYKMPNTLYEDDASMQIGMYRYHRRGSYVSKRTAEKTTYLLCYNPDLLSCSGAGELVGDAFRITRLHDHACRDKFIAHKANYRKALYDGVKSIPATPKQIHEQVARQHPIGAQFARYQTVKSSMLEWRNEDLPPRPTYIRDVVPVLGQYQWRSATSYNITIADEMSGTIDEATHELHAWAVTSGEGAKEATHVLLGYPTYARLFEDDTCAFADSTFEVTPNAEGCYQLFTLMVEHGTEVFPTCYVLMQCKDAESYAAVLEAIKNNLLPNFKPTSIMTDFETAQSNALEATFPEATMRGCFFHHCQAIRKYSQRFDSRVGKLSPTQIAESSRFKRDLMNLALLPHGSIIEAFEDLTNRLNRNTDLWEILRDLFRYYESFWIEQKGVAAFSVYGEKRRTNNVLERYHRSLREKIATRPEFYKFMTGLKSVQESAHLDFIAYESTGIPRRNASNKSRIHSRTLMQAWEKIGDLSTMTRDERKRAYIAFLNAVRIGPDRSLVFSVQEEANEVRSSDEVITPLPVCEIDESAGNEYLCRHFMIGCKTCAARSQDLPQEPGPSSAAHMEVVDKEQSARPSVSGTCASANLTRKRKDKGTITCVKPPGTSSILPRRM